MNSTVGGVVYFLHIPKTAGTSLSCYLESGFDPEEVCPPSDWLELLALPDGRLPNYRLFRGHFGAMLLDVLPWSPAVATMLRNPVEQAVSHWRYIQRHTNHPAHAEVMAQGPDLIAYVRSRCANVQTRHLAVDSAPAGLRSRMRACRSRAAVSRLFNEFTAAQPDLLERATDRLETCLAFGLVERFDDSVRLLAARLGWAPPAGLATLNAAPLWKDAYEPSAEEVGAVMEHDALDVELHARASRLFEQHWASAKADSPTATYERRLASQAKPLRAELAVDAREPFAGTGWMPPLHTGRGWVRWLAPGERASIDLPVLVPHGARVEVLCAAVMEPALAVRSPAGRRLGPVRLAAPRRAGPQTHQRPRDGTPWTLDVNGASIELFSTPAHSGMLFAGEIPDEADTSLGFTRLIIRAPKPVPWNVTGPYANGRNEGIAVCRVRLIPRERVRSSAATSAFAPRDPPSDVETGYGPGQQRRHQTS